MGIKSYLKENPNLLAQAFQLYSAVLGRNTIRGKQGNRVILNGVLRKHCCIEIHGVDNEIVVDPRSCLQHCRIYIKGDHNRIHIGSQVHMNHTELWIEDCRNELVLGDYTSTDGKREAPVHLAVIEGTHMVLGQDCMLSSGIEIRTGDSHSIILTGSGEAAENGEIPVRINPSKDVVIGNHVWIGTRAMILKGSGIADDCIVGAGSLVTGSFEETGCALAGNPAKILRRGISWKRERI